MGLIPMEFTVDTTQVVAIIGFISAIGGILGFMFNLVIRFRRLEKHDKADHETQVAILKALFAVLDGLKQQGCNGPVTKAHEELREIVIKH